jgi:hypothetical protein
MSVDEIYMPSSVISHIYLPEVRKALQPTTPEGVATCKYEVKGTRFGQRFAQQLAQTHMVPQIDNHTHFMSYPFTSRICIDKMKTLVELYACTAANTDRVGMVELCSSQVVRLSIHVCGTLVGKGATEPLVREKILKALGKILDSSADSRPKPGCPHRPMCSEHEVCAEREKRDVRNTVYIFAPAVEGTNMVDLDNIPYYIMHWPFVAVYLSQMPIICGLLTKASGVQVQPRYADDGLCAMFNTRLHPRPINFVCPEDAVVCLSYIADYGQKATLRLNLGPWGVCSVSYRHQQGVLPFLATINATFTDTILHTVLQRYSPDVQNMGNVGSLQNTLLCLDPERRKTTTSQNEVGAFLYSVTNGQGFGLWYEWLGTETAKYPWHEWYHQWCGLRYELHPQDQASRRLLGLAHQDDPELFRKTVKEAEMFSSIKDFDKSASPALPVPPPQPQPPGSRTPADDINSFKEMVRMVGCLSHYDLSLYVAQEICGNAFATGAPGSVAWWFFNKEKHRWQLDSGLSYIGLQIQKALRQLQLQIKAQLGDGNLAPRSTGRLSALIHFPEIGRCKETMCAAVVWLEEQMGSATSNNNIIRLMATHMWKDNALFDTVHDHLIPFKNGVLDLVEGRMRPGRASEMLRRGQK